MPMVKSLLPRALTGTPRRPRPSIWLTRLQNVFKSPHLALPLAGSWTVLGVGGWGCILFDAINKSSLRSDACIKGISSDAPDWLMEPKNDVLSIPLPV